VVVEFLRLEDMPRTVLIRLALPPLTSLAVTTFAYAQAAVEYAAKSSSSALSGSGGSARLCACPVDDSFITCLRETYPVAFDVTAVAICVIVFTLLFRRVRRV